MSDMLRGCGGGECCSQVEQDEVVLWNEGECYEYDHIPEHIIPARLDAGEEPGGGGLLRDLAREDLRDCCLLNGLTTGDSDDSSLSLVLSYFFLFFSGAFLCLTHLWSSSSTTSIDLASLISLGPGIANHHPTTPSITVDL